ncbi:putative Epoxide hydrolase [Seiridium unicorne]|uniref:Epoxide hydrolase n=1 Tax=Seiridium unicorne TaxID=138068 RepID=A0ABR2V1A3_9PEZI
MTQPGKHETNTSALCRESLASDPDGWMTIQFLEHGKGELWAQREIAVYIAAEFQWKLLSGPTSSNDPIDPIDTNSSDPLLAECEMEMTLTKRLAKRAEGWSLNEAYLKDEAFRPKIYKVRLERGKWPVSRGPRGSINAITALFGFRIVFDQSPFPPLEEWKKKHLAESKKFWRFNDFYGRRLSESQKNAFIATVA